MIRGSHFIRIIMIIIKLFPSSVGMYQLLTQGTADIVLDSCTDYWDGTTLRTLTDLDRYTVRLSVCLIICLSIHLSSQRQVVPFSSLLFVGYPVHGVYRVSGRGSTSGKGDMSCFLK